MNRRNTLTDLPPTGIRDKNLPKKSPPKLPQNSPKKSPNKLQKSASKKASKKISLEANSNNVSHICLVFRCHDDNLFHGCLMGLSVTAYFLGQIFVFFRMFFWPNFGPNFGLNFGPNFGRSFGQTRVPDPSWGQICERIATVHSAISEELWWSRLSL